MILSERLSAWAPQVLSVVRIVAGLIFLEHGSQKLLGFPPGGQGAPEAMTLIWWSGVIELVAGSLIALGLFTRPAAFLASGMCAFAYFIGHAGENTYPV